LPVALISPPAKLKVRPSRVKVSDNRLQLPPVYGILYVPVYDIPLVNPFTAEGLIAAVQLLVPQFIFGLTLIVFVQDRLNLVQTPVSVPQLPGVPVIGYVTVTLSLAFRVACRPVDKATGLPVGVPTVKPVTPDKTRSEAANVMITVEKELFLIVTEKVPPTNAVPAM